VEHGEAVSEGPARTRTCFLYRYCRAPATVPLTLNGWDGILCVYGRDDLEGPWLQTQHGQSAETEAEGERKKSLKLEVDRFANAHEVGWRWFLRSLLQEYWKPLAQAEDRPYRGQAGAS